MINKNDEQKKQHKTTTKNKKPFFSKQNITILIIGTIIGVIITSAVIKITEIKKINNQITEANKTSPTHNLANKEKDTIKKSQNTTTHSLSIQTHTINPQTKIPPNWQKETINIKNNKLSLALPENITKEHKTDYVNTITIWFGEINKSNALIISTATGQEAVPGWSGLPAGESKNVPDIEFMGEKIPKSKLVYEGITTKIFYGDNIINKGNLYFRITMDWFSNKPNGITSSEEALADEIIKLMTIEE